MTGSMKDVAKRAGVSTATVSRVLTGSRSVNPTLAKRVLEAMEDLDYQPVRAARSLRRQKSSILGLIISDIQNPFFTSLVRAVEDQANLHQLAVFLCNSDEDVAKEGMYVDLMLSERVAGVIICPAQELQNPSRKLIKAGIPVVSADRRMLDVEVDTVLIDNTKAAHGLVKHLILDGHHRIAAIVGPSWITTGRERLAGYMSALSEQGLIPQEGFVLTGQPNEETGYVLAGKLLDLPVQPTAVFVGNNLLATGVLRAIRERGLRIPDDIGLAAFDNMTWSTMIDPPLTVVQQPTYELGLTAVELLLERMRDPERPPQEVVMESTLLIRGSCGVH